MLGSACWVILFGYLKNFTQVLGSFWHWVIFFLMKLLKQFYSYSTIIETVPCTSINVWFSSATKSDYRRLWRIVRTAERIIGTTLLTLQELYLIRVSKRAGKTTLDPYIQHSPSLNCYHLVDATELWAPERPDTGTDSSLKQSISWTLDIRRGTHNTSLH